MGRQVPEGDRAGPGVPGEVADRRAVGEVAEPVSDDVRLVGGQRGQTAPQLGRDLGAGVVAVLEAAGDERAQPAAGSP